MRLRIHVLLIIAVVVAPFTLLRVSFFGIAELLIVLVFLHQATKSLLRSKLSEFVLTKFWLAFIFVSLIGMFVNVHFLDDMTSTFRLISFDLLAYLFILITCFSLERLITHSSFDVIHFTSHIFLFSGIVFAGLFALSFFQDDVIGLPLTYYGHFAPLADNLHQISMFLVPMPFIGLAALFYDKQLRHRWIVLALIPCFVLMAISTGSTKALLATVVGTFVLAYSLLIRSLGRRLFISANLIFAVLASFLILRADWFNVVKSLFEQYDVGAARSLLYVQSIDLFWESPFVGRGPGGHVELSGQFYDAHQTFLTVLVQSGLIGAVLFIVMLAGILRRLIHAPALLAAFSTIMVYAAGGDIMRRLPAWIMIVVMCHFFESRRSAKFVDREFEENNERHSIA